MAVRLNLELLMSEAMLGFIHAFELNPAEIAVTAIEDAVQCRLTANTATTAIRAKRLAPEIQEVKQIVAEKEKIEVELKSTKEEIEELKQIVEEMKSNFPLLRERAERAEQYARELEESLKGSPVIPAQRRRFP